MRVKCLKLGKNRSSKMLQNPSFLHRNFLHSRIVLGCVRCAPVCVCEWKSGDTRRFFPRYPALIFSPFEFSNKRVHTVENLKSINDFTLESFLVKSSLESVPSYESQSDALPCGKKFHNIEENLKKSKEGVNRVRVGQTREEENFVRIWAKK